MDTNSIIRPLALQLFEAEQRRLNTIIVSLNSRNKRMSRAQIDGFTYLGEYYLPKGVNLTIATGIQQKTPLHMDLWPELDGYLRDKKTCDGDMVQIRQCLFNLVMPCTTPQEVRDALPECLVDCTDTLPTSLVRLNRQAEPAWSIQGNARALRQYEKILPRMEVYSAARLIY